MKPFVTGYKLIKLEKADLLKQVPDTVVKLKECTIEGNPMDLYNTALKLEYIDPHTMVENGGWPLGHSTQVCVLCVVLGRL